MVRQTLQRRRRGLRRPAFPAPLALCLILGLVVAACAADNASPLPSGPPPSAPEPIAPRGAVPLPFAFSWKAVPGGAWLYRVTVTDAAERVLFQREVRYATSCAPSAELRAMLAEQHDTFTWSVAIVTPDGRVLVRSAPVPFSLK
jgi:hypothetical protein